MKNVFKKMDKPLFLIMLILTIFGLIMIYSSSYASAVLYNGVQESYFFTKQLAVVAACWFFGIIFLLRIPTKNLKGLIKLYFFGVLSALILLIPYGSITNSAKSWFNLGFINIQPSEFFKSAIILFLAVIYEKVIDTQSYSLDNIFKPLAFSILGIAFIMFQPDLGTALIVCGITGIIFLYLPINTKIVKKTKIIGTITAIIVIALIFLFTLTGEQNDRLTFQAPCTRYTEKTGYQVCNGMIAISNGGLFGVGLTNSTQKNLYLPEAHTDFIFPIVCEELGAVGGLCVILTFFILLTRLLIIAKKASTTRGKIIAIGTFGYILLHIIINFMGILALIPLTGVPVPFLSYGGSFYINLICMLFICERIAIETNNDKTKMLIKQIS